MAMAAEEDSIEQVVAARQERLRALKAAQELLNTPDEDSSLVDSNADEDNETSEETMKFRNYVPHDKKLQEGKLVPPVLPKFEDPVAAVTSPSEKKEDPFVNIAPKKPNWELRRDVQKKLDKLERRTKRQCVNLWGFVRSEKSPFSVRFEPAGWGATMEDLHSLLDMRGGPSIFVWEVRCKSSRTFSLRLTDLWSGDFSSFLQPSTQTSIFLACEFLHPLSSVSNRFTVLQDDSSV
ncbi:hypothetical protein Prudu_533S000500 [Prunus dulcis]|uniref:Coiled-coil domain-containing protein 12 n=1 Tax=Prunus dulcis TaxID=3755 RepID=A0A5H2XNK4_PRUDU|nr:hypothetical protein Prudu_533S000500 [Prunus dulcis]